MSRLTGKSDFLDTVERYGIDFIIDKCDVYVGDIGPLKLNKTNIIRYYPHIIAGMGISTDGGTIHLASKSYIETMVEERFNWAMADYKRYIRNKEITEANRYYDIETGTLVHVIENIEKSDLKRKEKNKLFSELIPLNCHFHYFELFDLYLEVYNKTKVLNSDFYFKVSELKHSMDIMNQYKGTLSISSFENEFQKYLDIVQDIIEKE